MQKGHFDSDVQMFSMRALTNDTNARFELW